jgi:small subunit ribosomal protein S17
MSDETNNETTENDEPEAEQPDQAPATEPVEIPAAEPEEPSEPEVEPAAEAETVEAEAPAPAAEAPPAEPARKRSRKHVPRSQRRTRPTPKREQLATRKPIVRLEKPEQVRGRRQERRGVVVSDAMDKTIVVKVDTVKSHRRYKKVIRRSVKFHAHDEQNQAHVGDIVRIVETRPLSKTKNWRLAEVLETAK